MLTELLGLAGTITRRQDVSQFARTVAERMKALLGVCECDIFVGDGPQLRYLASIDVAGFDGECLERPVTLANYPLCAAAMARREVLVIASTEDPRLNDYERSELERYGLASELWIPLVNGDHLVGAIDIYDSRPRDYAEILNLSTNVAQLVAGSLETALLLDQVDRRTTESRELVELGELASQMADLDAFIAEVAERLRRVTDAADCDIYTIADDGAMRCLVSVERSGRDPSVVGEAIEPASFGPNGAAIQTKEIVAIPSRADPRLTGADVAVYDQYGFESEVCVPLVSGDEVVGLVEIYDDRPREYAESRDFLRHVGQMVGGTYDRTRLVERLDRTNRNLALVGESSMEVSSTLNLEDVLGMAAMRLCAALRVPDCDIYTIAESGAVVCAASVAQGERDVSWLGQHFAAQEWGPMQLALRTRAPLALKAGDARLGEAARSAMELYGQTALLVVPLIAEGSVIGVVDLGEHRPERQFGSDEIELAQSICRAAALAVRNAQLHEGLAERTRSLSGLLDSARAISASVILEDVLEQVAHSAAQMLGSPEWIIWEYDPTAEVIIQRAVISQDPEYAPSLKESLSDRPTEAAVLLGGAPLIESISDPELDEVSRASMEKYGEKTCLTVALRFGEEPVGLIVAIETKAERQFSSAEVEALEALGGQAAVAIHNARLYRGQEEHTRRLASLLEVSRSITSVAPLEELLPALAQTAAQALGSPECIIFDYDSIADTLTAKALFPEKLTDYDGLGKPFALSGSAADRALLEGRVITVETISDETIDPASRASMEEWDEKTCVKVPLWFGDEPLGILVLIETERERRFSDDEIELLRGLSEQAAIALHNARQFERLESRTLETEVLNDIARASSASLNLPDIAAAVITQLQRLIAFERASLLLVEEDGVLYVAYSTENPSQLDGTAVADLDAGFVAALRRDRVAVAGSPVGLPLSPGHPACTKLRSAAVVGLFDGDQLIGSLALGSRRRGACTESDRRVLEGVSAHLSLAVKNAGLFERVKR